MADPLGITAGIIAILQLSSKVITYVNHARGEKDARKRLRDELRSCEFTLQMIKDHAEDLDDGDLFHETFKILQQPNAPLDRIRITLGLLAARLEPKNASSKTISRLVWPFSEREIEGLVAAIGREMGLLHLALSNNSLRLAQENATISSRSTSELMHLIQSAKVDAIRSARESNKQLESLIQAVQSNSTDFWKANSAQLAKLTAAVHAMVECALFSKEDSSSRLKLLESTKNDDFQEQTVRILPLLTLLKERANESQEANLRQYIALSKEVEKISGDVKLVSDTLESSLPLVKNRLDQLYQKVAIKEDGEERAAILKWLSPVNYSLQHSDVAQLQQEGTGQWLLESERFLAWMRQGGETCLYEGMPGAGKTIMTSIVIDYLHRRFKYAHVGIAYIYCNYKQRAEQTAPNLLAGLLKQLCRNLIPLPGSVRSLYETYVVRQTRPSFEDISSALQATLASFQRAFIVIDALDECQGLDGRREQLLSAIFTTQKQRATNFFATSRYSSDVNQLFKSGARLELRADSNDIRVYLNSQLSQLPGCVRNDPELQRDVKTAIVNAADGMFLLARLNFDSLRRKRTTNAIRDAIHTFPTGSNAYDCAYDEAMERIMDQGEEDERLAKQILSWVTLAKWQLTTVELQYALAIKSGASSIDQNDFYSPEDILSVCAGLVTLDHQTDVVRLVHYTAQQYFMRTREKWFPQSELDVARICVSYLMFDKFKGSKDTRLPSPADFQHRRQNEPFLYAAYNWGLHARECSVLEPEIIRFLSSESHVMAWIKALPVHRFGGLIPKGWTGVHIAAYFGITKAFSPIIPNFNPEAADSVGRTPLILAASEGHKEVVRLLLDTHGVCPNYSAELGLSPLSYAAGNGHHETVCILLQDLRIDINSLDRNGRTPLSYAAGNGHHEIVSILLQDLRININSLDRNGRTPIFYAAMNTKCNTLGLLLQSESIDVNHRDLHGDTVLLVALKLGYSSVVDCLLYHNKINVNCRDTLGRTPLIQALIMQRNDLMQFLTAHNNNIDLNAADRDGCTPLSYAVLYSNDWFIFGYLLNSNEVDVNAKDRWGRTALFHAARSNCVDLVQWLLRRRDIDPNTLTCDGFTPLSMAVRLGHEKIVKLLHACPAVDIDFSVKSRTFYKELLLEFSSDQVWDRKPQSVVK